MTLAVFLNGDPMSTINFVGLLMCLGGITTHVIHKIKNIPKGNQMRFHGFHNDNRELEESLMINSEDLTYMSSESDGEQSDSQVLFNILNRHER